MDRPVTSREYLESSPVAVVNNREAHSSGVSWGAVIGGAFVASALYLTLLALGAGFGLAVISPWSSPGAVKATDVGAVVWLLFMEVAASAVGGYLTGRLRTKWALIHTDEVYFRDTANGFLAWAVAMVVSAGFLASAGAFMASGKAPMMATETRVAAADPEAYYVDALFRTGVPVTTVPAITDATARAEAARILVTGLGADETMLTADQQYLARLVALHTGITLPDAQQRVADVITQARLAADTARKTTAHILLWLFVACLLGAFCSSLAATIGGRQRDHVPAV